MPLTNRERKAQARAELEALIADLMTARRNNDRDAARARREELIAFNTPFPDLNEEAEDAAAAAILENLNDALEELAEIATRLGSLGDAFRTAREVARKGKKELLVPRLAATAAQGLELFTTLKQATDTISDRLDALGQANDLGDVRDAITGVLDALDTLRDATRNVSTG